jgi:hypothetical protein
MHLVRIATFVAAAALVLGAGAPARAIDSLTGTYEGKMSCKGQSGINATKTKADIKIDVLDAEVDLLQVTVLPVLPVGAVVELLVLGPLVKPDRAKIGGVDCTLERLAKSGIALQADAVIKPGSEKGTLKGSFFHYEGAASIVDVCTFAVKRTTTTAPELLGCPD